jgi:hypothetical protein
MKFCIKCAEELADDARFCSKCGTKQNNAAGNIDEQTKQETVVKKKPSSNKKPETKQSAPKKTSPAKKTPSGTKMAVAKRPRQKATNMTGSALVVAPLFDSLFKTTKSWLDKVRETYELTPQEANYKKCKKNNQCGCNNCYGFAMQVAAGKMNLDECPYHE